MNNKTLATLWLVAALVCVVTAASKEEVFGLINKMANEQEWKLHKTLSETVETILAKATTMQQRLCVREQNPAAHKSITDPIDTMWERLTLEYQRMSPVAIERIKLEPLTRRLKAKYIAAVSTIEPKLKKIRKCVP